MAMVDKIVQLTQELKQSRALHSYYKNKEQGQNEHETEREKIAKLDMVVVHAALDVLSSKMFAW